MSNNATAVEAAQESFLSEQYAQNDNGVAVAAFIIFDYVITISQEARVIWGRKWSAVTIVFILNRISAVWLALCMITNVINFATLPSCKVGFAFLQASSQSVYTVWAIFSALRVYAISGRRLRYAVVVFLLTIVTVGLNIYNVASVTCWGVTVVADMDVCMCGQAQDIIDLDKTLRIVAGSCLIVADCAVLLITWLKTYGIQRALSVLGCKAPLVTLLLRDGTLYFLVKLVLTAVEFGSLSAPLGTDVSWIAQGIRTIIISRFLLNLRQVDDEPAETAARPSNLTTMQFSEHFFSSFEADVDTFGPDVLSDDLCEILEPDAMKIDEHGTDQSGEGLGSGASTGEIVEEARA